MSKTVYLDKVAKGAVTCGFCSTNNHTTCRGGYRNGDGSVLICGCQCADSKTEFCHHCKTTDPGDLGRPWLCDDRDACEGRLKARIEASDFYQSLNQYLSSGDRQKYVAARMRVGGINACLCCGESTRGGRFLPGHDSKWLTQKISEIGAGLITRDAQVMDVAGVSPALALKLQKRLDGKVG